MDPTIERKRRKQATCSSGNSLMATDQSDIRDSESAANGNIDRPTSEETAETAQSPSLQSRPNPRSSIDPMRATDRYRLVKPTDATF
jgi:hypothetical protein